MAQLGIQFFRKILKINFFFIFVFALILMWFYSDIVQFYYDWLGIPNPYK